MINKHSKQILAFSSILLLSCNSNYTVSTNLDSNNFKEYFSPSKVTIYQSEQEIAQRHKFIGLVEGEDCQLKEHHAAPDKIIARTNARKEAFKQQANAIVFTGCATIDAAMANQRPAKQQCLSTLVCYGKAYQVSNNTENTNH